jgi:hypothetical protein
MKIAHIINVVEIKGVHESSYLHVAQPVTVDSMVSAKNHTKSDIEVQLFATKHQNEKINLPSEFTWTKDLSRYCYDVFDTLPKSKNFPLIGDILNNLYNSSNADFFIYTNVDIGVFPNFYDFIKESIDSGLDAFTINRVTMPKTINKTTIGPENYNLVFSQKGLQHPGFDCFVFRREYLSRFSLGSIFIGAPPIGAVLKNQLSRISSRIKYFKSGVRATFHLGNDRDWANPSNPHYIQNCLEAKRQATTFNKVESENE